MIHTSTRLLRIREKLCLDQHQMSFMLEIKRTLLSMIELEKRSEPPALKKQLDLLESLLFTKSAIAKEKKAIESTDRKADRIRLQKEINGLKIKLEFAIRNLTKMETRYVKNTVAAKSFQTLIEHSITKGSKPHPIWKQQLNILDKKIKSCDTLKQVRLKARIQGMKSELEYLEKILLL
jgi:transcriptional regulator with XRE-family HTH domain